MHSRSRCNFAAFTALNLRVLALAVVSAQAQMKTRISNRYRRNRWGLLPLGKRPGGAHVEIPSRG